MSSSTERASSENKEGKVIKFEYFLDQFGKEKQESILRTYSKIGAGEVSRILHLKRELSRKPTIKTKST
jgi:hypothetical protein